VGLYLACLQDNVIPASDRRHDMHVCLFIEHRSDTISQYAVIFNDEYFDLFHQIMFLRNLLWQTHLLNAIGY